MKDGDKNIGSHREWVFLFHKDGRRMPHKDGRRIMHVDERGQCRAWGEDRWVSESTRGGISELYIHANQEKEEQCSNRDNAERALSKIAQHIATKVKPTHIAY
jgi:hypothetical protein